MCSAAAAPYFLASGRTEMRVVVTGVTGLVGGAICRAFLPNPDVELYVTMRPSAEKSAAQRWDDLQREWHKFFPDLARRNVTIIEGDFTAGPALSQAIAAVLPHVVVHAAALTRFDQSLNESWDANVEPVRHLIRALETAAPRCRLLYLSTAFVAGTKNGLVQPTLARGGSFRNHYERSKWVAEHLMSEARLPWLILRPSIVVGDSRNGYTPHFRVFYALLRIWFGQYLERSPCRLNAEVDCVPVDYIATATVQLALRPDVSHQVLHLCAGRQQLTARALMTIVQSTLAIVLPKTYPLWCAELLLTGPWRRLLPKRWQDLWQVFSSYIPYMLRRHQEFDTTVTDRVLAYSAPSFAVYGGKILEFCKNKRGGLRAR